LLARRRVAVRASAVRNAFRACSRRAAVLAPALVLSLMLPGGCRPPAEPGPPNVVLITVESLRADHVGAYGYARETTPTLDTLASEGIVFENAYAVTSWTLPAHASILTGLYPAAHRVVAYNHRLDDSYPTLAELLGEAGYQTAAFVSGPFLQSQHNLDQGFQVFDQSASNPGGNQAAHSDVTNDAIERLVTRFLAEGRDPERPLFLFVYLWDPHYDYIPPAPWDAAFVPPYAEPIDLVGYEVRDRVTEETPAEQLAYVVSQYDGEIAATDALLGRLFERLDETLSWDDTLVVVTSDHGEEFFEHGTKGHRNNLYEESLRIPLIVRAPGVSGPVRDSRLVSQIDIFPTILEAAGIATAPHHHGRSLLAAADAPPRPLFFELKTEWVARDEETGERGILSDLWLAVRDGDLKLVLGRNEGRVELFDLSEDPTEQVPLGPGFRRRMTELDRKLQEHLEAMKADGERWERSGPVSLSPGQEDRLRSLGYLGPADDD
jgi:arylsulfatase A-like enzyme